MMIMMMMVMTIRYANRAKNIKNKPKINEDPKDAMLREYQEQVLGDDDDEDNDDNDDGDDEDAVFMD